MRGPLRLAWHALNLKRRLRRDQRSLLTMYCRMRKAASQPPANVRLPTWARFNKLQPDDVILVESTAGQLDGLVNDLGLSFEQSEESPRVRVRQEGFGADEDRAQAAES